jgi:SAM-dependent methyltransferase
MKAVAIVGCLLLGALGALGMNWFQWTMPLPPRFMASELESARLMLRLADVHAGELVADLGCGDGRIVIEAVRAFGARGLCVELDADVLADARANARIAGVSDSIRFVHGNVLHADLTGVDVVTLYLSPDLNLALRDRLQALRSGARVVSQMHGIAGWPAAGTKVIEVRGAPREFFLWRVN